MVGMERKKENSRAEARDMPTSWPLAMVDMDREVQGKTAERMGQRIFVTLLAAGVRRQKFGDAVAEIDGQTEDGAELDDDGVHLPIPVGEGDVQQAFGDAQVGSGAHR